jgi:hypothetical protein
MERLVITVASLFALVFFAVPANAQNDALISDQDCQSILEAYAVAPKTVAPDVVKACEEVVAGAPGIYSTASVVDCSAPGASGSVNCWGNWAGLAPAGAGLDTGADGIIEFDERDFVQNPQLAANGGGPPIIPPLPLGACVPGGSCGFSATSTAANPADPPTLADARLERFRLADDGNSFVVDEGGANEVQSITMATLFLPPPTGAIFPRLISQTGDPVNGPFSAIFSRVNCDPCISGDPTSRVYYGADEWQNIDANGNLTNGIFGWGRATSQGDLDALNAGNASLTFSGVMSLDSTTTANLNLHFGGTPIWDGEWSGGYDFTAEGVIDGPNFISTGFGPNVTDPQNSYVQGAVLGQAPGQTDKRAAVLVLDVEVNGLPIRDAGILVQQ